MNFRGLFILLLPYLSNIVAGEDYHFDGAASLNGDGSLLSPFNSLTSLSSLKISPGDSILLKRGTSFPQALELYASGSASHPIIIQSYGDNAALPRVQANPSQLSSILLNAASHIIVQDLEVTNRGNNKTARRGVYLYAKDAGEISDITVRRLYIHNVEGYMPSTTGDFSIGKYSNASGGIVLEAAGNTTATYFKDIVIDGNVIDSVGRQGIYTWSNWCRRNELAQFWYTLCFQNWAPSTGLVIRNNRLSNIGGDGIVVKGNVDAVTSYNHVTTFNLNSGGNNAGIWTANSINSLFHHNIVSGGTTTRDGMAYDVDHSTSGTVYEYNISHDNQGGFFLLCPYDKPTTNFTIRYNLSINDQARIFQVCPGNLVGGTIYKNTVVIGDGLSPNMVLSPNKLSLDVLFTNNIVRKFGSGNVVWKLDSDKFNVTNNVFYGIENYPSATKTLNKPPQLAAPGLRDLNAYMLLSKSPAYESAIKVPGDTQVDSFSNPTSVHNNIGLYSGPITNLPQWINTFDDSSLSGWTVTGVVTIVADPAGDFGNSVKVPVGGRLSRAYKTQGPMRLDARIMVLDTSDDSGKTPTASFGSYTVSLTTSTPTELGFWHILELTTHIDGTATASWNGRPIEVSSAEKAIEVVEFAAGESVIYLDDIFIVSL